MKNILIFVLIQFFFQIRYTKPLFSQTENYIKINNIDSIKDQINSKISTIDNIKCSFEYNISNIFSKVSNSEFGELYFKKESKFIWKFIKPDLYSILINNETINTNKYGFIDEYNEDQIFNYLIYVFSSYYNKKLLNHSNSYYRNSDSYLIRLIADSNPIFDTVDNIEIIINNIDYGITAIRFNLSNNLLKVYTFRNRIVNGNIDEKIFKL
jgi:outer membrane lipoprotein-sorting protein